MASMGLCRLDSPSLWTPHSLSTCDLVEICLPSYIGMLWRMECLKVDNIKPQCFQLQNLMMDRP